MKKYTIYLIAGLMATLVLLLLSSTILDSMFSGQTEFANEMYNNNLYFMTTLFIASSITAYNYCDGIFANDGVDYSDQLFGFSMTNLLVEVLLFVIASYGMRWWSSNCRHTPIPE